MALEVGAENSQSDIPLKILPQKDFFKYSHVHTYVV